MGITQSWPKLVFAGTRLCNCCLGGIRSGLPPPPRADDIRMHDACDANARPFRTYMRQCQRT